MAKRTISITMTEEEAKAVIAGLKAAFDFSVDYFMFSPGEDGYNSGNLKKNDKLELLAVRVVDRLEDSYEKKSREDT